MGAVEAGVHKISQATVAIAGKLLIYIGPEIERIIFKFYIKVFLIVLLNVFLFWRQRPTAAFFFVFLFFFYSKATLERSLGRLAGGSLSWGSSTSTSGT